ncbi:hypothetical protein [Lacisediminimonas sp.]|uniref:hypothetical protein n=1 Tax=Lacisediminimonas sp. TaxID=3060582 RepID=UPI002728D39F|nr:hypothetical protein [Lacisediminimonas sp.]MDO8299221.1 hypothetical protein [Lacisediminimonas sp.]
MPTKPIRLPVAGHVTDKSRSSTFPNPRLNTRKGKAVIAHACKNGFSLALALVPTPLAGFQRAAALSPVAATKKTDNQLRQAASKRKEEERKREVELGYAEATVWIKNSEEVRTTLRLIGKLFRHDRLAAWTDVLGQLPEAMKITTAAVARYSADLEAATAANCAVTHKLAEQERAGAELAAAHQNTQKEKSQLTEELTILKAAMAASLSRICELETTNVTLTRRVSSLNKRVEILARRRSQLLVSLAGAVMLNVAGMLTYIASFFP